jgi:putative membrane protein
MLLVAIIAGAVAALLHVAFFVLESVLFRREDVWRRFVDSPDAADALRPVMFNQGCYNLFLAIGAGAGALLLAIDGEDCVVGLTLVGFACACMVGASLVLLATDRRRFVGAAFVQGLPALVALVAVLALARG